jgi:hypothetical protein
MFYSVLFKYSALKGEGEQGESQNRSYPIECYNPLLSGRDFVKVSLSQKEMVENLRSKWKKLWQERAEDRVRAEGIATSDYCDLFVEKGTIIQATRNFKSLNFREILEQHQIANVDRYIAPNPQIGGWNKFIKTNLTSQESKRKGRSEVYCDEKKQNKRPKKGGRGWLHL